MAKEILSFESIMECSSAFERSCILFTALELDIFSKLSELEPVGEEELCEKLRVERRAGTLFLNALCALGFLEKDSIGSYRNGGAARRYLVAGSEDDRRAIVCHIADGFDAWKDLTYVVRTGKPRSLVENDVFGGDAQKTRDFIYGMDNLAKDRIKDILPNVPVKGDGSFLDMGGGLGTYAIGFCEKYPHLEGVVYDLPAAARLAEENISKCGMGDRVKAVAGNILKDSLEAGYQTIWCSQFIHCFSARECMLILKKCYSALVSGGQLVIHDFFLDDLGISPAFGVLFSIHMLVCMRGGQSYSVTQVREWLLDAGFKNIEIKSINSRSSVAIAFK